MKHADILSGFSLAEARRIDQTCDRFEAEWRAGRRPNLTNVVLSAAEPSRSALLRLLLPVEWEYRRNAGENPQPIEYQTQLPDSTTLIEDICRELTSTTDSTWEDWQTNDESNGFVNQNKTATPHGLPISALSGSDRYQLLQEVGHGGIGVVYRVRDRMLGRESAVKMLHDSLLDNADACRRLLEEARVGSQLQHPAIVPVYEIGSFNDRPYFAMKLVEGQTLAQILRDRPDPSHDLPRMLGIYEQVCQAIAYAHSKGVIHRDLKPANVMVGAFGEVQVMDWGFAKQLPITDGGCQFEKQEPKIGRVDQTVSNLPSANCNSVETHSGALMGTPAYMPPEQARGEISQIDRRADVFALGAILCEILSGKPPYSEGKPDERCRQAAEGKLDQAYARIDACEADNALRILAKRCLTANCDDRPSDAAIVANEVTEYLASAQERLKSLEVERATAETRARAERRVRVMALTAALVFLVGAGIATWQAFVAIQAKHDAIEAAVQEKEAKDVATAKEAETAAIWGFVESRILAAARPKGLQGGQGPNLTLRAAIDSSIPFVQSSFRDRPLVEARLRRNLGTSYWHFGDGKAAAEQNEAALAIYLEHLGPDHRDTLLCTNDLGISYGMQGQHRRAVELFEQLLPKCQSILGSEDSVTLMCMNNLGRSLFISGQYEKAREIHETRLAIDQRMFGPNHASTLRTMVNLANCYGKLDRKNDALALREKTLEIQKATLGPDNYETLMTANNLSNSYRDDKRFSDALKIDEDTLKRRSDTLGADHPDTLLSHWGIAMDLIGLNRADDALASLDTCLRLAGNRHIHDNFWKIAQLRLEHFEKNNDVMGCRTTAEMWEQLSRSDIDSLLQAARCHAVIAKVIHATDHTSVGIEQTKAESAVAMEWLRKAVAAGFNNIEKLKKEKDFDELHNRADFQRLIANHISPGSAKD